MSFHSFCFIAIIQAISSCSDAFKWNKNIQVLNALERENVSILIVRFENIIHHDHGIASNELLKMIRFLYRDDYYEQHEYLFKHRIDCVWNISATDKRMDSIHRDKPTAAQLNISYAYQIIGHDMLCKIWNRLKPFASQYGYTSYNNVSCEPS